MTIGRLNNSLQAPSACCPARLPAYPPAYLPACLPASLPACLPASLCVLAPCLSCASERLADHVYNYNFWFRAKGNGTNDVVQWCVLQSICPGWALPDFARCCVLRLCAVTLCSGIQLAPSQLTKRM